MLTGLTPFLPEDILTLYDNLEFLIRIVLSGLLGVLIGYERSHRLKDAGIRTHCLIACSAAVFMILSKYAFLDLGETADNARIAAQVVGGISFIGAGVIFRQGAGLRGLTTAAGMWATAAVGMSVGAGLYWLGLMEFGAVLIIQVILHRYPVGGDALTVQEILVTMDDDPDLISAFFLLLTAHEAEVLSSDISREPDRVSFRMTARLKTPIEHTEAVEFLSRHKGIHRMSV